MASPPTVAALADLVSQFTAAQAPQQAQIDNEVTANDESGTAGVNGINAAKDAAFSGIKQESNDRGAFFSGFTPSEEAGYTGSTYLPALAKLQTTIEGTKNTLLGQKADLVTQANTAALGEQKTEQSALDSYNAQQEQEQAEEQRQQEAEAASAQQAALDRQEKASEAAASAGPTAAEQQASDFQGANNYLLSKVGGDQKVSPNVYRAAKQQWVNAGYSSASFDSNFGNYINTTHAQDYK